MPLQQTSGNVTADAYGGGVAVTPVYIEQIFSTWLYTGTAATQTITNGIDLSGQGGLVWTKDRSLATYGHNFQDTIRGAGNNIQSNTTNAQVNSPTTITSFNSNGYTIGTAAGFNNTSDNFVSWTFRKQPKFFDIVTYTGNGATTRQISHNLGSVPGCIIIKATSGTSNWFTYHRGDGTTTYTAFELNSTAASTAAAGTTPTSTYFNVQSILDSSYSYANNNGVTYVAYLFAHNAGGFGLTGTDNVISCGSYTEGASATTVTLGFEPQWLMIKKTSATSSWYIIDNMRAFDYSNTKYLEANTAAAEASVGASYFKPTPTGFIAEPAFLGNGSNIIYIAIRRGPMKVPTDGTKVFLPYKETTSTNPQTITTGFPVDFTISTVTTGQSRQVSDRLRGGSTSSFTYLLTDTTGAEATFSGFGFGFDNNTGLVDAGVVTQPNGMIWSFRRAPSFFDEVCYTGTGVATTIAHNLGVVPELMIVKQRDNTGNWAVYTAATAATNVMYLNTTNASFGSSGFWNNTAPTTSVFTIGNNGNVNNATSTYVAYLFATCPGVSKVGTYTGNGTTQTINCGFAAGARFVLIKRTDSTGNWYVYDTARGMTTLTDPYLLLNSTAAETATLGSVTTVTTGFAVNAAVLAAINTNAASYIYLSIA